MENNACRERMNGEREGKGEKIENMEGKKNKKWSKGEEEKI